MKLLSHHQICSVLETRLNDYRVSCKKTANNTISLVLTHIYTGSVYGVSGIRTSDYRGPYGATILAKTLLEAVQNDYVEHDSRVGVGVGVGVGKVISIVRPVEQQPTRRNLTVLTLLARQ